VETRKKVLLERWERRWEKVGGKMGEKMGRRWVRKWEDGKMGEKMGRRERRWEWKDAKARGRRTFIDYAALGKTNKGTETTS
jgi:hypothetical protein